MSTQASFSSRRGMEGEEEGGGAGISLQVYGVGGGGVVKGLRKVLFTFFQTSRRVCWSL